MAKRSKSAKSKKKAAVPKRKDKPQAAPVVRREEVIPVAVVAGATVLPKLTDRRPLADIQADLRAETAARARGDHRKRRQV